MFCKNCGTQMADNVTFCPNCGAPVTQEAPQQPVYQAPVYEQPAYQQPVYQPNPGYAPVREPLVSKKEFLATKAKPGVKKTAKLSTIVMIVAAVLIVVSYFVTLNIPMFDIPVMSLALSGSDTDTDEMVDELKDEYKNLEDKYDMIKDDLSSKEKKEYKKFMEATKKVTENFSISNFENFMDVAKDMDSDLIGKSTAESIEADVEELEGAFSIVKTVVLVFLAFPLLFILLTGWKKSFGLGIAALIFTTISQLIFVGIVMVILSLVVNVYQCILCSNIGKAYKRYRKNQA